MELNIQTINRILERKKKIKISRKYKKFKKFNNKKMKR